MVIIGAVLLVLVLGAVTAMLVTRTDVPGVTEAVSTASAEPLASGPVTMTDVRDLRFDVAIRGYRMEQVDAALDRLAGELGERDAEIARLRAERDAIPAADAYPTGGNA